MKFQKKTARLSPTAFSYGYGLGIAQDAGVGAQADQIIRAYGRGQMSKAEAKAGLEKLGYDPRVIKGILDAPHEIGGKDKRRKYSPHVFRQSRDAADPKVEREMRDRMNGIKRDKDGNITHRNGKSVGEKKAE